NAKWRLITWDFKSRITSSLATDLITPNAIATCLLSLYSRTRKHSLSIRNQWLIPSAGKKFDPLNHTKSNRFFVAFVDRFCFFNFQKRGTLMRQLFLFLIAMLTLPLTVQAQTPDFSKVEITATKVAGNIYMLQGQGGNIGVSVGADGILIVDDQFAPLADKIKAALKTLGEGKLKFVLNTHWH